MTEGVKKQLSTLLVCICKNENAYLNEFINYYKNLGVTKICIVDNNDVDGEEIAPLLQDYIDSGFVTIENYRGQKPPVQMISYTDMYNKYKNYDWIMFFDADEYLTLVEDKDINDYLNRDCFKDFDLIHINWKIYGDNGNIYKPNGTLLDSFTTPMQEDKFVAYNFPENAHIKSIIRGDKENIDFSVNPHTPSKSNLKCCNNAGIDCLADSPFCEVNFNLAYLKHFNTKSTEEYINKMKRGFPDVERTNIEEIVASRYFRINEITEEKVKLFNQKLNINLDYLLKRYKGNRNSDIKIFSLCYSKKEFDFIDDSVVTPLQVGAANGTEVCETKDNTGRNISQHNYFYTENTGTFWIWQNIHGCKYKGQMQYRRPLSGINETFDFDEAFSKYDVITCVPFNYPSNNKPTPEQPIFIPANTVAEGYAFSNCKDDLDILEMIIKLYYPDYVEDYNKYINHGENLYYSNGYILKESDFDKYCEFLFNCLGIYIQMTGIYNFQTLINRVQYCMQVGKYIRYQNINTIPKEAVIWQSKIGGFLSERIWTLWLLHNYSKDKILELPYIKQENNMYI